MFKKTLISAFVVAILTGCGGGGGSSTTPPPTPTPAPTPTPSPAPATSAPDTAVVQAFSASIAEMGLAAIINQALPVIELRNPENLVALTLDDEYGLTEVALTDISYGYELTTLAMWQSIYDRLQQLDTGQFTQEQQVNFDILSWVAMESAARADFVYFDYQASYFLTSVPRGTQRFFSDLHPLAGQQDVEDYLTRLALVDELPCPF